MAKWYDAANEASFKTVAGGYVFQSPSPWVFARPRYYLVNEAQKAGIAVCLRRWRLLMMTLVPVIVLIGTSVAAFVMLSPATAPLFKAAFLQLGVGAFTLLMILLIILLAAPLVAVPQIYLMRALRPLLADAPRTNERITMGEQLPKIAASVSGKLLVVGLVAGLCTMGGAVFLLLDAFFEGHLARSLPVFLPPLVAGGVLAAYFVYLVRLKAKLKRVAP